MESQSKPPDTLYKYLSVSRTRDFLENPGISLSSVCLFEDKREGICQSHLPDEQAERMLRDFYENSRYGILCLCENSTNFEMWEKYAEDHRGIMVGFDPMHPFFKQDPLEPGWNKVNYADNVPTLPECPAHDLASPPQEYKSKVVEVLREGILRKDEKWRFEAEWRKRGVLAEPASWRGFYFSPGEISSIVRFVCMGANINKEDKSLCEAFCNRHQIPLYQATLSDSSVTFSGS